MQSDMFMDKLLLERIEFLATVKDRLFIYTTNPWLNLDQYADDELKFILKIFNYIDISVLGTTPEDYLKMAGIDGFDRFYRNLYRTKRMIDENRLPTILALQYRTFDRKKLLNDPLFKQLSADFKTGGIMDSYFSWSGSITADDLPVGARLLTANNRQKKIP